MAEKPLESFDPEEDSLRDDDVFSEVSEQRESQGDEELPSWLKTVDSPFTWLPTRFHNIPAREIIAKMKERIKTDDHFCNIFPFEKAVMHLVLVYELSHQRECEEALEQLTMLQQLMTEEENKDVETYHQLKEALTLVQQAAKAHLLYRSGKITEAKELADGLPEADSLSVETRATMAATKAQFFHQYRGEGAELAVELSRQALSLSPQQPLWQVLTAQSLRRLRKFQLTTNKDLSEEIALMESSVKSQRNVRNLLLLAEAYREQADIIFKANRNKTDFFHSQTFADLSNMQAKAFELYKESLSLRPDEGIVNRLCGYGLLKLPAFKSDYRLAHQCLQRAMDLDPTNSMTIHAVGLYFYKGLMDYDKAALFCEKAGKLGNFPASLDMLRMKHLVYGNNYDPVFDFSKLLRQYGDEQAKRHEILCQMGSYYLFFERNLPKALKYFKMLIKEGAEQSVMTSHKCTFLNMACKINLLECVVNEGSRLLRENNLPEEQEDSGGLQEVQSFLDELKTTKPELFENLTTGNIIDDLHKVSDDIKQTYVRKKERRDSLVEKRRNSSSRRSSLEESKAPYRRHSDVNSTFWTKSSGNVFDNSTYKSRNKSRHSVGSFSGSSEYKNKPSSDKSNEIKRKINRSMSVNISDNRQRHSSGNNEGIRNIPAFKRQTSERLPPRKPEVSFSQREIGTSNDNALKNTYLENKKQVSWSRENSVIEIPNEKNWRAKD